MGGGGTLASDWPSLQGGEVQSGIRPGSPVNWIALWKCVLTLCLWKGLESSLDSSEQT